MVTLVAMTWWIGLVATAVLAKKARQQSRVVLIARARAQGPNYLVPEPNWNSDPNLLRQTEREQLLLVALWAAGAWTLIACASRMVMLVA